MERVDKDENRSFYDSQREDDRHRFEEHPSKVHLTETLVPWIVSHVAPGDRIIDIGGGSGVYASRIVREAPVTVVGLDISASMIEQREEDPLLTENVVADMEAIPFPDGSFDAAMFVGCLHHVPDPLPALREAHRILRPGGTLFAAEPCSLRVGRAGVAPVPGHQHEFRFTMGFLTGRIREAGFRIDEVTGKRISLRFAATVYRSPPLRAFHAGDRLDRVLTLVPGVNRLGELALVRASRLDSRP
jgi:ubiquinone/menaquinone biosynthesis C-methylase UbiE